MINPESTNEDKLYTYTSSKFSKDDDAWKSTMTFAEACNNETASTISLLDAPGVKKIGDKWPSEMMYDLVKNKFIDKQKKPYRKKHFE